MSSEAQLDGSADTCSSRSSVDKSQPPSPAVAAIVDEAGNEDDDDSNHSPRTMTAKRAFPPPGAAAVAAARKTIIASVGGMNIIQQRMKQTQQSPSTASNSPASVSPSGGGGGNMRPKSKLSLIRHVFKTYTKGRRVVDVKVRWAEGKIRDLDDHLRLRKDGRLDDEDDDYEEQNDRDGTIAQTSPATPLKRPLSSEDAARSASSSPLPKRSRSDSADAVAEGALEESSDFGEEWSASMFDFESLQCKPCSKTFPNAARLSAHKQMHLDEMRKKKKRCKASAGQKPKTLPQLDGACDVDFDTDEEDEGEMVGDRDAAGLPQLDGENDVMMPMAPAASAQVAGPPTTSIAASQQQRQNGGAQSVILTTSVASNLTATFSSSATSAAASANPTHVFIVRAPQQQSAGGSLSASASQVLVKQESFQQQSSKSSSSPTAQSSTASTSRSSSSPVSASALPAYAKELLVLEHAHPMLIKQDPVMVPLSSVLPSKSGGSGGGDVSDGGMMAAAAASDAAIVDQDLILPDALHLFEGTPALDSSDSAIQISLDDIANFAQPINTSGGGLGSVGIGGAESHASFDTSIETSSFLSGADALDIVSETTNGTNTSGIRFGH